MSLTQEDVQHDSSSPPDCMSSAPSLLTAFDAHGEEESWLPPEPSRASRTIPMRSTASYRGSIVDAATHREHLFESSLEQGFIYLALASPEVVELWEQPPAVAFVDVDGRWSEHTFDMLLLIKSRGQNPAGRSVGSIPPRSSLPMLGPALNRLHSAPCRERKFLAGSSSQGSVPDSTRCERVAIDVKPRLKVERSRILEIQMLIREQVGRKFADRYLVRTEDHIHPDDVADARLILRARRLADPAADAAVAEVLPFLVGWCRLADLVETLGGGSAAFNAAVRAVGAGVISTRGDSRLSLDSFVRRAA